MFDHDGRGQGANSILLTSAKVSFGALSIMRHYMKDDVNQALVALAIILRTRRDIFSTTGEYDKTNVNYQAKNDRGFYTSINEISQFTKINRATIRRKMQNLEKLGIIEKVDGDKWHFKEVDLNDDVPIANMLRELLLHYLSGVRKVEDFLPNDKMALFADKATVEVSALLHKDAISKTKRGLAVNH